METHFLSKLLISVALVGIIGVFVRVYNAVVAEPRRLQSAMRKQGLKGPPPTILLGNLLEIKKARDAAAAANAATVKGPPPSHNCGAALFSFFGNWRNQYGDVFMFSLGSLQIVHVTEPEMVKEITTCTSLDLGRPTYEAKDRGPLLGQGILTSNGPYWAHQKKIIAPELYMDKGMINVIQESTMALLKSWMKKIEADGGLADIKIDEYMGMFSGDVISRACFGSNYADGEEIFMKFGALKESESKKVFMSTGIPFLRHIPTKSNREAWALEKEIKDLILNVVKGRKESGFEKDLLQTVLEGAKNSNMIKDVDRFIVDNCKNIYLAGYETTAVSAAWCLMLLASHPEWQQRIRDEVVDISNGQIPDAEMIRKMKLLSMAINESLRLYPPVPVVSREALKDMKFGNLNVPKGMNLWTIVTTIHTDPKIWGPDSYQFNPARFANGITGACKFPYLYMPFGVGPRVCLGQNLALVELKILISSILSKFSLSLSPKYVHSPAMGLVIEPGLGVNVLMKLL
ncbi:hypothetical protein BUALT_Bualt02G0163600 [Buddleja alternifolia]|uniref:Cytochrome P450 n=1 Tax=Buddleja alternifolia TaxID=168488 RepID=A0AAV6YBF0_9LAMI|nr:hypothetical protein BUALT_Bualt02G0163600 [Buddleja alternifolia]